MEERKTRGQTQNIYLLDITIDEPDNARLFDVMGASGRSYVVKICNRPECSCPDFTNRRKRCKHIYFVLIKIMGVNKEQEDQSTFTNVQLKEMYENMSDVMKKIREGIKIGNNKNNSKINNIVEMRSTDDICPICLDDLTNGSELDYCKYSCGKCVHIECFSMWVKKKDAICVFCSKNWHLSTG